MINICCTDKFIVPILFYINCSALFMGINIYCNLIISIFFIIINTVTPNVVYRYIRINKLFI